MALLKPQHRDGTSRSHKGKGTCSSNQGERKDILRGPRHARPVPLRNILSSRSVTSVPRDNAQSCVTGRSGKGALLDDVGIEAQRAASGLLRCQTGQGGDRLWRAPESPRRIQQEELETAPPTPQGDRSRRGGSSPPRAACAPTSSPSTIGRDVAKVSRPSGAPSREACWAYSPSAS
jgi:hypothetical protein